MNHRILLALLFRYGGIWGPPLLCSQIHFVSDIWNIIELFISIVRLAVYPPSRQYLEILSFELSRIRKLCLHLAKIVRFVCCQYPLLFKRTLSNLLFSHSIIFPLDWKDIFLLVFKLFMYFPLVPQLNMLWKMLKLVIFSTKKKTNKPQVNLFPPVLTGNGELNELCWC